MQRQHRSSGKTKLGAALAALLTLSCFAGAAAASDCSEVRDGHGFVEFVDYISASVWSQSPHGPRIACIDQYPAFKAMGYTVGRLRDLASGRGEPVKACGIVVHRVYLNYAQEADRQAERAYLEGLDHGLIGIEPPDGLCGGEVDYVYAMEWLEELAQRAEALAAQGPSGGTTAPLVGRWQLVRLIGPDGTVYQDAAQGDETYYEFRADGTVELNAGGTIVTGRWSFDAVTGRLDFSEGGGGTLVFEDGGQRCVWYDDSGITAFLLRL